MKIREKKKKDTDRHHRYPVHGKGRKLKERNEKQGCYKDKKSQNKRK